MLMNEMNNDNTFKEAIVTVQMAEKSKVNGKVTLMINNKIYVGDKEYYGNNGLYDNSDNTLKYVSDNDRMFTFFAGRDFSQNIDEIRKNCKYGSIYILPEDFDEFKKLTDTESFADFRKAVTFLGKSFDEAYAESKQEDISQESDEPKKVSSTDKKKTYRENITNKIIEMIETGTAPWQKPWNTKVAMANRPRNFNGRPYHGMNAFLLWYASMEKNYSDPRWLTFNQIKNLGGKVKKGEKAMPIELWLWTKKEVDKETGEEIEVKLDIPYRKIYNVFNAEQAENIPELKIEPQKFSPHERAENIIKASGVPVHESIDGRAYYSPLYDSISVPPKNSFSTQDGYYSTVLHELGHSTGHSSRLDRFEPNAEFGSESYAREELRAELASTFMCNELGISLEKDNQQHAAYIKSWVNVLKKDYNEIFRAAADADKICCYLYDKEKEYLKSLEQSKTAIEGENKPTTAKDFYLTESKKMMAASGKVDNEKIAINMLKAGFSCYTAKQVIYKYSPEKNFEKSCSAVNKAMKDPEVKKSMQKERC